jgi:hypothetical protein
VSKKKGVCGICFLELDGNTIDCPACEIVFHKDHLAAWLRLKNNQCPYCRYELPIKYIEQLTPKTREEGQYLDSLEYLFGDLSRYNILTNLIEKRESSLRSNKQYFFFLLLVTIIAIPFMISIIEQIYDASNSDLLYFLIILLLVTLSIFIIIISLLIKIRRSFSELEELINLDKQKLLDF